MDEQLKRRLIGATVLVSLAIIFLPMLLEHKPVTVGSGGMAPIPQEPERDFDPSLLKDKPPAPPLAAAPAPPPEPVAPAELVKKGVSRPAPVVLKPELPRQVTAAPAKPEPKSKPKTATKPAAKPNSSVAAAKVSPPSGWVVQAASLSSRENARKLVMKLRKAGLDTMDPRTVTVKGKTFYRVQVGPEIDRKRLERLLPKINRIAKSKGKILRYP